MLRLSAMWHQYRRDPPCSRPMQRDTHTHTPHGERHLSYARIHIYGLYVPDEKGYCNRGTRVKACEAEATSLGHKTKSIKRCRHKVKMRSRERERGKEKEKKRICEDAREGKSRSIIAYDVRVREKDRRRRRRRRHRIYMYVGELRLQGRKELVYTRTCCSLYNTCVVVSWLRKRARLGVRRATATTPSWAAALHGTIFDTARLGAVQRARLHIFQIDVEKPRNCQVTTAAAAAAQGAVLGAPHIAYVHHTRIARLYNQASSHAARSAHITRSCTVLLFSLMNVRKNSNRASSCPHVFGDQRSSEKGDDLRGFELHSRAERERAASELRASCASTAASSRYTYAREGERKRTKVKARFKFIRLFENCGRGEESSALRRAPRKKRKPTARRQQSRSVHNIIDYEMIIHRNDLFSRMPGRSRGARCGTCSPTANCSKRRARALVFSFTRRESSVLILGKTSSVVTS
ncbi:unnamed protein product [Trichogramma brassicae]|uniref:Uncharacterized protein n=1 Tax=Trichogramma brassicae TaxID=86971 RepID=A0A6H5IHH3_9HYME|nr:unnamed protein product [Trichogramma brassicae]